MPSKVLKISFFSIVSLFVLFSIGVYALLIYKKPNTNGEVFIKNIDQSSKVYYDDFGIPHIYSSTEKDAMTVLGYVHAQDRLWQMELLRRISPGKLSEIFGSKALDNDKFFISLGIHENSLKTIENLDKNAAFYKLSMAYLDGINQYIEIGKTPIEFELLQIKPEPFTLVDVQNIIGYMAFSFAMAHKTDPMLSLIKEKFGDEYLKDFGLDGEYFQTQIKTHKGNSEFYGKMANQVAELVNFSVIPPFIGSNSWVIGADKTKNGKVIFANDPHIAFSQPGTWYEAHLHSDKHEIYGYFLAGVPFPLLGHNRQYAYGLTMFENDDVDFFLEEVNPENENQYKYLNKFKNFETKEHLIKIKDSTDFKMVVKSSVNGPIFNQNLKYLETSQPISIYWEYLQGDNHLIEALYGLTHAKDLTDFYQKVAQIHAPGLNIMYGDSLNNVAWITSGRLYQLNKALHPYFINENHQNLVEKRNYIPYSKNPHAINPENKYVYSANNQTEAIDNYLYPGYYLPQDRAKRIVNYLEPKNDWTLKDVQKMIVDDTSDMAKELINQWLTVIDSSNLTPLELEVIQILKSWNGGHATNQIAPTVYNKWLYEYLKNTFMDELGEENFKNFIETHLMKQMFAHQSLNPESPWWDDISTKNIKETQQDVLTKSFKNTIETLKKQLGNSINQWAWGNVHTLTHNHPLGSVKMLNHYFNVGPTPISGSNEVINNMLFYLNENGNYQVKGGPSTRRIIDFSDVENSVSILPTGQSGVPSSKHYNDQFEMYNKGEFRKMKMNKKEIVKTSSLLIFKKIN